MTTREWQKAHPDLMREYQRRWVEKNRDHYREYQREYRRKYRALKKEEAQNGNLRTDQAGE